MVVTAGGYGEFLISAFQKNLVDFDKIFFKMPKAVVTAGGYGEFLIYAF